MKNDSRYTAYALLVMILFFLFRLYYIATTSYTLIADEAYFWEWARHPDLSYYDMGPMVAWIIRFFTTLFPLSEFSVRIGAPILSLLTAMVLYRLAQEITGSRKIAFYSTVLFHITPIATAGGIIMTYYSPQVFFMSLSAFFLWRLVKEDDGRWGYALGASLGMGQLSHHQFAIFSIEVLLFILLSRNHRKWFKRKELYIAILIECIIASPIVIWNVTHGGVMMKHAAGLLATPAKALTTFFEYIGGQAGVQTPLVFIAVLYGVIRSGIKGIKDRDDRHLLLFSLSAPMLVFVGFLALGGRVEANWPISAYITASISALWAVSDLYQKNSRTVRKWIMAASLLTILLCTLSFLLISYPKNIHLITGISLPAKLDPANRLYGWRELGKEVSLAARQMKKPYFIAGRDYGVCAQLAFYVEGHPLIHAIPDGRRMNQYDFWNDEKTVIGKDALLVTKRAVKPNTTSLFKSVELIKQLTIRSEFDQSIRIQFYIYHAIGYKGPLTENNGTTY